MFELAPLFILSYLDPGSGSLLIQLIVGALVGLLVFFRGGISFTLRFFGLGPKAVEDEDEDIEEVDQASGEAD